MKECINCGKCFEDDLADCLEHRESLRPAFPGPALIDGKYLLIRKLGHGAMGTVYLARHTALLKDFAVKLIHPRDAHQEAFRARFRIEAQALGRLSHPAIVQVTDFGIDPRNIPYLVMEFLEGESLATALSEKELRTNEIITILRGIAAGIDHAHENGVLHRDLKSSNVFLSQKNGDLQIKLLDFGIASISSVPESVSTDQAVESTALTQAGEILGTADYAAPEVCSGKKAEPASDIYSFGIIAYELFAGKRPFQGSFQSVVEGHRSVPPSPPSSIRLTLPRELDVPILDLLKKAPDRRPVSAKNAVEAIEQALQEASRRDRASTTPRWKPALALLIAAAACAVLFLPLGRRQVSPKPAAAGSTTVQPEARASGKPDSPLTDLRIDSKDPFVRPKPPRRIGVALRADGAIMDLDFTIRFLEALTARDASLKTSPIRLSFAASGDFSRAFNGLPFDFRNYHPEEFDTLLLGYESLKVLPRKPESPTFEVLESMDLRVVSPLGARLHAPIMESASGVGLNVTLARRNAMETIAARVASYL